MKKNIFLIILIVCRISANGQIVFENEYDSASTWASGTPAVQDQLMIINFEISGEQYVKINRHAKKILIYNMNHVLIKSTSLSTLPTQGTGGGINDVLYLSEQLFNTDSKKEFLYTISSPNYYTGIYNEDGTLLFSDTGGVPVRPNFHMQQYPVYNTTTGTKMIISYSNMKAKVFSLPGTLSTAIAEANGQLMQAQGGGQFSNLYPNPSKGAVTLQYELPKGEQFGEIVLYNSQGEEVKRYKVDNTFNDILLDNSMLPAGTYFYRLQTGKGAMGSKKMIVVK